MPDHTYAITHIVGTSHVSIDEAIENGLATAGKRLRNLDWFEVSEVRGYLGHTDHVKNYQVTMKVGFRYDDAEPDDSSVEF